MKKIKSNLSFLFVLISSFCFAQDSLKIINPFPLFPITSINAIVDSSQNLTVNVKFENRNNKPLKAYFRLGGYDNFGLTDISGKKYKLHTSSKLIGTKNINEGYTNIDAIIFGTKKQDYFTYVQDTIKSGTSKNLSFTINKFDKQINFIEEIHIKCKPSIDFSSQSEKIYIVNNIPIIRLEKKSR